MKTTNVYPHVVAPATATAQSLPGFDTVTLSYRFASGTLPFQTLSIHIKRNIMKSIFTPVKTVIAVLTFLLTSSVALASGGQDDAHLVINNETTFVGCSGGTIRVNFSTQNGNGSSTQFRSVEQASGSATGTQPTTFTVSLSNGVDTYSGSFQATGVNFPTNTNGGLTFDYDVPLPANVAVGNYTLTVSSVYPIASVTAPVAVNITLNPTDATLSASAASVCVGAAQPTVTFQGSGQTGGSYTFYYTVDGAAASVTTASGVDNATVNIPNATAHTAVVNLTGVSHTAAAGCGIKNLDENVNIEIYPATAITSFSAAAASYCMGDAATAFSVSAVGGNLNYQWYSNTSASNSGGAAITGAQSATYTPDVSAEGTMYYYVVVTGDCGSATSSVSGAIVVNALPSGSISGNLALDCNTTSTTLTAPAGASYLWSTGATTSSITVATAGTFTVVVTSAAGCSAEFSASTTLNNTPPSVSISASSNDLTCTTPSSILTATGADSYVWANGLGSTASITVTAAGTYTVTGTNAANGCSADATVTIADNTQPTAINAFNAAAASYCIGEAATALSVDASGANLGYQWYSNTSASNSGGTAITGAESASYTPDVSAAGTMYYYVAVTGDCGTVTSSVSGAIVVNALPSGSISGNLALDCNTTSTTLTAPAGASYLWSTGATTSSIDVDAAGTFTVVVTNDAGCSAEFSATTTMDSNPPVVSASASVDELTCNETESVLTASGADSYVWANGLGNTASITVSAAGTYTVTGYSSANGCSAIATVTVGENKQAPVITAPASTELDCNNTSVVYSISDAVDITIMGGGTVSIVNGTATFNAAGNYTITATSATGCSTTQSVSITEAPLPTAIISAPAAVCSSSPVVTLNFAVTGRGNITVNYTDGDASYSVSGPAGTLTASATLSANTTFSITSVVDGEGCGTEVASSASIEFASCNVTFGIDRVDPTCAGSTNGKIVITNIQGDGAPFQISKNNGFSFEPVSNPALFEFKNLGAGVYNIILKNKDGKLQPLSTTSLVDPKPITANINTSGEISCGTPSTMLMISNVQGGNGAPYTFSLDGGAFVEATSFEVGAGAHSIMAKDKNGCTQQIGSVTLNGPAAVVMGATQVTNVSSFGGNNGSISLTVSGGSNSYQVTLVRPGGSNTIVNAGNATVTFGNLVAGEYQVMVEDNDGCGTVSKQLTISQPEQAPIPSADLVLGSETNTNIFNNTGAGVSIVYNVMNISATGDANQVKLRITKPSRDYSISLPAISSYTNGAGEMVSLDNKRWTVTADNDLFVELSLDNDPDGNNMIPAATIVPKHISVTITRNSAAMGKGEFPISAVIYASLPDANDSDNGTSHKYTAQ